MLRGRKIKALGAATAISIAALAAGGISEPTVHRSATAITSFLVGASAAHAQSSRQVFPDSVEDTSEEAQQALSQFSAQRQALSEAYGTEEGVTPSSDSSPVKDILIALLGMALGCVVGYPFAKPHLVRTRDTVLRKLHERQIGAKVRATGGKSDESGRVAAARLVGRSDDDLTTGDEILKELQHDLQQESAEVAGHIDRGVVNGAVRVASVVHPSAEAIARSPVSTAIRRDRNGMAAAASAALQVQTLIRSSEMSERQEPGAAGASRGRDKALLIQEASLGDRADRMYRDLQRYYGFGSRSQLKGLLSDKLFAEIEPGLQGQDGTGIPQVLSLVHQVLEVKEAPNHFIGRIAYQVTLKFEGSPAESSSEVFTFIKNKGPGSQLWKLDRIAAAEECDAQTERLAA